MKKRSYKVNIYGNIVGYEGGMRNYVSMVLPWVKTKLGVWVEDKVYHVDYAHADRWVKQMGDKISSPTIIF